MGRDTMGDCRMNTDASRGEVLTRLTRRLDARARELDCQYGISHIVENAGGSITRILDQVVRILPAAWEYPDITCARIVLRGREFRTHGFRETPWRQTASLTVHGEEVGLVEVRYREERPPRDEGPFLAEDRALLDSVAQRLGHVVERIEADQRLREQEAELHRRLTHLTRITTLGEMASAIAHEVNQPLTAIAAYTQACRRMVRNTSADNAPIAEILGRITDEALRAGEIIHRLKDLVRRRDGTRELCDLNGLIRQIEHLADVDARLHQVDLRLDLAAELPPVWVDAIQIQQVLLNLIRNAVDALDEPSTTDRELRVSTSVSEHGVVHVSVSDHGCGLPADMAAEVFQPFYTTKPGGVGLGLSISRSIVTAHEGRMWFERNADRGTTFHFTLPGADGADHE